MHLISQQPESKIPEAAAAEILEDYILLWMDRRHVCENNMKKECKGMMALWRTVSKGLVHSQSPSVCSTSNKLHPNATNAMKYREWIDEICLPYQQIA